MSLQYSAFVLLVLSWLFGCSDNIKQQDRGFLSNDAFITGLYTGIDLDSAEQVFKYVFEQLDDEVVVYPSENYYYFKFTASGKTVTGSLHLLLNDPNEIKIGLGYVHKIEDKHRQKDYQITGGWIEYVSGDGIVEMEMVDDFTCRVLYQEREVTFKLFQPSLNKPKKANLLPAEIYVGPSFDESGLQFYLIFNKESQSLYWLLNEDVFVPEAFLEIKDDILLGDRTEFVFYADSLNTRKLLIGVEGKNVLQNNWYDGPFDQMPDNYARTGDIEILPYLEKHYPQHKGKLNKFGCFLKKKGMRVPVAPYRVYWSCDDFSFIDSLKEKEMSTSAFYKRLTQQIYSIPQDERYKYKKP